MLRRTRSATRAPVAASAALATLVLCGLLTPLRAMGADDPTPAWQKQLAQIESMFRSAKSDDAAGRAVLETKAKALRTEIETWLKSYPPAVADGRSWIEPAAAVARLDDLAVEIGALRAAIARVAASFGHGGDGVFFLGRMDVAVTAEASAAATSDIAPAGAAVVDSKEIAAYDRMALSEALALAPGVTFVRAGSRNETTVSVRGFDIRQVPIFIDGIPIYTPYDGYADLERFTTFDMAEIHISKGFSSVIYGPNALGGAINVVSRRPRARLEGTAGLSVASGISRNGFANLGSRSDSWYVQGGASYLQADSFPLSRDFVPVRYQAAGKRDNAYRRDGKFNVKLGLTPNGTNEYAISYVGQRGQKGNPVYAGSDPGARARFWKWPYWNKDSVYLVSNTDLGNAGYVRGRAFYDKYDNKLDSYDDNTYTTMNRGSSFQSFYHDHTFGGSVEWGKTFGSRQTVRAAFHVKRDVHTENNLGAPVTQDRGLITALGVEDTVEFTSNLSLVAGIGASRQTTSLAQNLQSGAIVGLPRGTTDGVDPQVGLFYSVSGSGQVRATVSHKTRLPTMKDRYSFKFGTAVPNPGLKPERSTTFETGYQGGVGTQTTFDASVFYSRITDLIQQFYLAPNLTQQQNIGRASAAGFELGARNRSISRVEVNFNYSFLRRKNISGPSVLPIDAPRHKELLSITVEPVAPVHVMGLVEFESERKIQNPSGRYIDIGSIATLSAKVIWTIREQVDAELAGTNLTDNNYWLSEGYPEAGRMVRLSMNCRF